MKYVLAGFSFVFTFVCVFVASGLFLMPYLPPVPTQPVTIFESAYWSDNWIGFILGTIVGVLSARSSLKYKK